MSVNGETAVIFKRRTNVRVNVSADLFSSTGNWSTWSQIWQILNCCFACSHLWNSFYSKYADLAPSSLRMIWSCWRRAALLLSAECCPWRGRLFWAQTLRSSANRQLNSTQKRLWRSSSDTSTTTCRTRPRRRNSSDRFTFYWLLQTELKTYM